MSLPFWIDPELTRLWTAALLHLVWQGCVAGLFVFVAGNLLQDAPARWRYRINLSVLLCMGMCLPLNLHFAAPETSDSQTINVEGDVVASVRELPDLAPSTSRPIATSQSSTPISLEHVGSMDALAATPPTGTLLEDLRHWQSSAAPWIVHGYLLVVLVLSCRLIQALRSGHQLRRRSVEVSEAGLRQRARHQARQLGLKIVPLIATSSEVSVPVVVGVFRPAVLLPAALVSGLSVAQLEAILLHEMAHIRRHDPAWNLIQRGLEVLLFFHPTVWYVSRRVSVERENCCDDLVLQCGVDAPRYADALVRMAELSVALRHEQRKTVSVAAAGRSSREFRQRVLRLLTPGQSLRSRRLPTISGTALALMLLLCVGTGLAWSRTTETLSIETADQTSEDTESSDQLDESSVCLRGQVIDPDGNPVVGAVVLFRDDRGMYDLYSKDLFPRTDAEGRFELRDVHPGFWRVTAFSWDWALTTISAEFPSSEPVTIKMRPGHRLEFRTVDTSGQPISNMMVFPKAPEYTPFPLSPENTYLYVLDLLGHRSLFHRRTDADGRWIWENAPPEALHYQISGSEHLNHPGDDFAPRERPYTLVFRKQIQVNGHVQDIDSGQPISDFHYVEESTLGPGLDWPRYPLVRTGTSQRQESGQFDLTMHWLQERIRARVTADGYWPAVSRILDPREIRGSQVTLPVRMQPLSDFTTQILTPDGEPAAGCRVGVFCPSIRDGEDNVLAVENGLPKESQMKVVRTADDMGRVTIPGQSDSFVVVCWHPTGFREVADIELLNSQIVALRRTAAVSGRVMKEGAVAGNTELRMMSMDSGIGLSGSQPEVIYVASARTNERGEYHFSSCRAGDWEMKTVASPTPPRMTPWYRRNIRLLPGENLRQNIGDTGVRITGRVRLPKGIDSAPEGSDAVLIVSRPRPKDVRRRHRLGRDYVWEIICAGPLQPDGSFQLPKVPLSDCRLAISLHDNIQSRTSHGIEIELSADRLKADQKNDGVDVGEIEVQPSLY